MKKAIITVLSIVMALSLAACSSGKIKDGTYRAEASEAVYGYTTYLAVTYKDGAISDVDFDAIDADGALKSALGADYGMEISPDVWMKQIEDNVKKATAADKIDTVAGATNSSNDAKVLMKAVEESAKKGSAETVKVEFPKAAE